MRQEAVMSEPTPDARIEVIHQQRADLDVSASSPLEESDGAPRSRGTSSDERLDASLMQRTLSSGDVPLS
ncbi:hypothetical protein PMIN01_07131 [Paraphaeosphaeria minitans]|uniref:Uncharacterized protein n=1 Tax=Paraphaeosphaeria minitans TaxID=565426 RepID=A0A9P6KP25_9PLEO|nr:hypothetical protein PMIN01_07131 [Paraphaeosphaeria minitans]